jgi:hypothetical protein
VSAFASSLLLRIQPDDPWGFDEAPVETWADILGPQYLDLALLTAFIALAFYSFTKKSVPLKYLTFAAAIGYMGFAKSYLISITNIFSIVDWNWPVVKYNRAWYLFFGFTVVSTILWGRLYCGRVCAYGAITQTLDGLPDTPSAVRFWLRVYWKIGGTTEPDANGKIASGRQRAGRTP